MLRSGAGVRTKLHLQNFLEITLEESGLALSADENSPQLTMDHAVSLGAQLDPLKSGLDFRNKRQAEARFPILAPLRRVKNISRASGRTRNVICAYGAGCPP